MGFPTAAGFRRCHLLIISDLVMYGPCGITAQSIADAASLCQGASFLFLSSLLPQRQSAEEPISGMCRLISHSMPGRRHIHFPDWRRDQTHIALCTLHPARDSPEQSLPPSQCPLCCPPPVSAGDQSLDLRVDHTHPISTRSGRISGIYPSECMKIFFPCRLAISI